MKFNDLTIRELRAQAEAACRKVVRQLPEEKKAKYSFVTVDYIEPMALEDDEMEDWEEFSVLGHVTLDDGSQYGSKITFKAYMVWMGDSCDLAGPKEDECVEFNIDIESALFER